MLGETNELLESAMMGPGLVEVAHVTDRLLESAAGTKQLVVGNVEPVETPLEDAAVVKQVVETVETVETVVNLHYVEQVVVVLASGSFELVQQTDVVELEF